MVLQIVGLVAFLLAVAAALPPSVLPARVPADRAQLAVELNRAQAIIDSPSSATAELRSAGEFEQLAAVALERDSPRVQRATLARLHPAAAASMRADLAAGLALGRLVQRRKSLPPWKVISPPAPNVLLGYFRHAQARYGVGWQYLAAIEFIESKFGRVTGVSSAGAEGPMQFLPATWARYGRGDVRNPRDAILGAARYLVASGARHDMAGALYHYNPSTDYVAAVQDYAARMRADARAYYGYYYWQVIYAKVGGSVILPVGYPRVRPVPIR
jgi:membrane-bound lytic murein transglycosylase B